MMRFTKSAGLILASAAFLAAQSDPPGRIGRLNYMEGSVSFQPTGVNDWIDASVNRPLTTDDNIWVGTRGRAEFHVGSTALRLGANTSFQFLNLDDDTVQIRLSEGTLTARVRNLPRDQVFEIDTPNLAFTLMRPGEYRIDVNPDNQTTIVTVRDGEGEVTGGGEAFPLYARQRVVVRGDDQISYNLGAPLGLDEWDQWSTSRDRREDQSPSARYVSREIAGYDDLDQYGRWGDQPGYGNVWMPNSVAVGWAPYHDGHWAWISPWGWTWVDEAPWGFAPYHYGRWASFNGRWGWIPGPYGVTPVYAPALVGWVGGGRGGSGFSLSFSIGTVAAVGWFPLGPREPYFPSYQSSQGYFTRVNNTNTVINNVTINNYYANRNSDNPAVTNITYVNRSVQNGVTAVPQETFARGRRVNQDARPVSAAQLTSVRVMAAPAIAPQRESVLGARADTASRAARPPANVISRPVVARTAPPPAPISFDRQQPALTQNPGRPLAPADVRGKGQGGGGQSPQVKVMDLGRVRRVQPTADGTPQGAVDRQKGGGQQQRQAPPAQVQQPQAREVDRQKGRQQQPQTQVPQGAVDRQNGPPGQQQRQAPPPQIQQPPAPEVDRQKGRQQQQQQPQTQAPPAQVQQPPAPEVDRQKGRQQQQQQPQTQAPPAQVQPPAAPEVDRQKGRQRQDPPPAAPAVVPVAPAQPQTPAAAPPAAEKPQPQAAPDNGKQRQDKGKGKSKQDDNQKKSDR